MWVACMWGEGEKGGGNEGSACVCVCILGEEEEEAEEERGIKAVRACEGRLCCSSQCGVLCVVMHSTPPPCYRLLPNLYIYIYSVAACWYVVIVDSSWGDSCV